MISFLCNSSMQLSDISASPQRTPTNNNPFDESRSSSRAASPALEATELDVAPLQHHQPMSSSSNVSPTTATDEESMATKSEISVSAAATRRKSSTWKAFNIKKQLIKVDSRLRNTFVTAVSPEPQKSGSTFYTSDGEPNRNASQELAFAHNDRNEYLEQIESEIVQSLNEVQASGNEPSIMDSSDLQLESDGAHHPKGILCSTEQGEASHTTSKKVEFTDEPVQREASVSPLEGCSWSRPADLPLTESATDEGGHPVPPPRIGKLKNNKQRLLSVPNIKYTKQQQPDFPMRGKMSVGHKDSLSNLIVTGPSSVVSTANHSSHNAAGTSASTSFANSFMRRFSKY